MTRHDTAGAQRAPQSDGQIRTAIHANIESINTIPAWPLQHYLRVPADSKALLNADYCRGAATGRPACESSDAAHRSALYLSPTDWPTSEICITVIAFSHPPLSPQ